MQSVNIPDDIMEMMNERCKQINCNPEKLIHSILFDYLKAVEKIPRSIDFEMIQGMLDYDNPEGDDFLENLSHLEDFGWD